LRKASIERASVILGLYLALACPAQWVQAQEPPNSGSAPSAQTAEQMPMASPAAFLLPEATPVKLKLLHSLNSKTVVVDDPLNFALAEDLIVNGKIITKTGVVAIGRVRQAKPARTLGRGGQLALEIQYMKVGRIRVPLRSSQVRSGNDKKGETVTLVVLFGLSGLVKHGSEIEIKEGAIFTAYVDKDTELPPQPETKTPVQ
jgi:hypothetical protein